MTTTSNPEIFSCPECGGSVRMLQGTGRFRVVRPGLQLEIPSDLPLPACEECGEMYLRPEDSAKIDERLAGLAERTQKRAWGQLVASLQAAHSAKKHEVARVLGITQSHLSHILSGQAAASITLTRFAETLLAAPSEFQRHLVGEIMPSPQFVPAPKGATGFGNNPIARWAKRPFFGISRTSDTSEVKSA